MANASWKDGFYAALLEFVKKELDGDAVQVTSFEERISESLQWSEVTFDSGYVYIEITYKDSYGRSRYKEWRGNFAELIQVLSDGTEEK